VRHKLTVLLVDGILLFLFELTSRREGNRELSRPALWKALRAVFPELEAAEVPHMDTVERLLERIPAESLEEVLLEEVRWLLRHRKLQAFMVRNSYVFALDGTHQLARDFPWTPEALRWRNSGEAGMHSTVYVLTATLVTPQGMTLPIAAEFCANEPVVGERAEEAEARKQDCERKAFQRLAKRLKENFPRLPILVVADSLYANGPVVELCRRYHWDFMMGLRAGSLPTVWAEAEALHRLAPEQTLSWQWGDRQQTFWWVNGIEYEYGPGMGQRAILHVVVCEEHWKQRDQQGNEREQHARFAWLSGRPLTARNVPDRCNRAARHRWDIEEHFRITKWEGYQMTHAFSWNGSAMRCWHYLMLLACLLNTLACYSTALWESVRKRGLRGTILFLRETYLGPWLNPERLRALRSQPAQLRLVL